MKKKEREEILDVLKEHTKNEEERPVPSPFKTEVSKPESGDEYTSITQINQAYDDQFVVKMTHDHRKFKFLCNRVPLFDLLPDQLDRDVEDRTMHILYEEAITVIVGTVVMPKGEELTYETIATQLPVPFVLRLKNEILNEISPGFGFGIDDEDADAEQPTDEVSDAEQPEECEIELASNTPEEVNE